MQLSSGTTDPAEFSRRNHLLTRIANIGLADLLQAVVRGEVGIDDLLRFEREENLRNGLQELRRVREQELNRLHRERPQPVSPVAAASSASVIGRALPTGLPDRITPAPDAVATVHAMGFQLELHQSDGRPVIADADAGRPVAAVTPVPRTAPSSPDVLAPTRATAGDLWRGVALNVDFSVPLWPTFLEKTIPGMLDVSVQTRRRYETSIRSLRQKLSAFGCTAEQFEILADIGPDEWDALALARSRGLEVAVLRSGIHLPLAKQRLLLSARNLKVPVDVFHDLADLTDEQWDVLESVAELPITSAMIERLEQADAEDRAALRRLATTLGPAATMEDLGEVTTGEWHALSRCWGASGSDWNHLRRALSACLSCYIGTDRHLFRQLIVDRIPLLPENRRVPDITLELLARVAADLPEHVRYFPWVLVLTGCRIGEYLRLEPEHLKANVFTITVPGTKTAGSQRSVHVDPDAWWLIEAAVPCYLQYGQLRKHWRAACQRNGVHGVTIHDLRHVCGQTAADGGAKIEAIQAQLGHATAEMALRYARRRDLKDSSAKIGQLVVPHLPTGDRGP
jgi:integrase